MNPVLHQGNWGQLPCSRWNHASSLPRRWAYPNLWELSTLPYMTEGWSLLPKANGGVTLRILRWRGYPGTWVCPKCNLGVLLRGRGRQREVAHRRRGGNRNRQAETEAMQPQAKEHRQTPELEEARDSWYVFVIVYLVFLFIELPGYPIFLLSYPFPRRSWCRLHTLLAVRETSSLVHGVTFCGVCFVSAFTLPHFYLVKFIIFNLCIYLVMICLRRLSLTYFLLKVWYFLEYLDVSSLWNLVLRILYRYIILFIFSPSRESIDSIPLLKCPIFSHWCEMLLYIHGSISELSIMFFWSLLTQVWTVSIP